MHGKMSIAKIVGEYIEGHAIIKECMADGLINYSALSRHIMREHGIKQFDAVLIACRRASHRAEKRRIDAKAKNFLKRAGFSVSAAPEKGLAVLTFSGTGSTHSEDASYALYYFLKEAIGQGINIISSYLKGNNIEIAINERDISKAARIREHQSSSGSSSELSS
jgi:hypothetical protein